MLRLETTADGIVESDEVEVTVQGLPTYAQWVAGFTLTDTNPLADPDFDGLINLIEFALGSDPALETSRNPPTLLPHPTNPDDLLYSYRRRRALNPGDATGTTGDGYQVYGLSYTLEASSTLGDSR